MSDVLRKAAATGDIATLVRELEEGADIDSVDGRGMTALMHAAMRGQEETARVLLLREPDLRPRATDGWRALTYASANTFERTDGTRTDVLGALIEAGDRPEPGDADWKAIHYAAEWGNAGSIAQLVSHGLDPDVRDTNGMTALMRAARKSKAACVAALVAAGASLDLVDRNGRTALMYAADRANLEQIRTLTDAGADRTLRDAAGLTAADVAREAGKTRILALLELGAAT